MIHRRLCYALVYECPLNLDSSNQLSPSQQVDNKDSLENVSTKWIAEIAEHCQGVKIVLVALKCDLREVEKDDDDDEAHDAVAAPPPKSIITYQEGLDVAKKIGALRYLGEYLTHLSRHSHLESF